MASLILGLAQHTVRDLPGWLAAAHESGHYPRDQLALRAWLAREHDILKHSQWASADTAARGEQRAHRADHPDRRCMTSART